MERIGVVFLHRGEPGSPEGARDYLRALYADPHAVSWPIWSEAQRLLAGVLARIDAPALGRLHAEAGGVSTLARQAEALGLALESALGRSQEAPSRTFLVRTAFRYSEPSAGAVIRELAAAGVSRFVGLTLYPQLCPRFLASSVHALERASGGMPLSVVDRYGEHPGYLAAVGATISAGLSRFGEERDRVGLLFAAPSLDRAAVSSGDPYPAKLRATVKALVARLQNPHRLAFYGDGALGPGTADAARSLAAESGQTLVVPLGGVLEDLALVHALDVELRKRAGRLQRVPALATEPSLAVSLAEVVLGHLAQQAQLGFGG